MIRTTPITIICVLNHIAMRCTATFQRLTVVDVQYSKVSSIMAC